VSEGWGLSVVFEATLLTVLGATIVVAAAYDVATLTIPNWISLLLVALFPVVALLAGIGWTEAGLHVAIGVAALALGVAGFAGGIVGGGDAKLFAALSLYMGVSAIGAFVFVVALAGGALAGLLLLLRRLPLAGLSARWAWTRHALTRGAGVPYGVAIAAGGLLVLPATRLFALVAGGGA
jgi:prepilin peptidase CpaA